MPITSTCSTILSVAAETDRVAAPRKRFAPRHGMDSGGGAFQVLRRRAPLTGAVSMPARHGIRLHMSYRRTHATIEPAAVDDLNPAGSRQADEPAIFQIGQRAADRFD